MLPAATYPGLKRLDLRFSREFKNWDAMPQSDRDNFKGFFGTVASLILGFLIFLFLPFKHPLILLLLIGALFMFFKKVLK